MTTRNRTILTCDKCKSEAPARFDAAFDTAITPWMQAHGWLHVNGSDMCPACLMDADAATTTKETSA
jgi:hypothetical protein